MKSFACHDFCSTHPNVDNVRENRKSKPKSRKSKQKTVFVWIVDLNPNKKQFLIFVCRPKIVKSRKSKQKQEMSEIQIKNTVTQTKNTNKKNLPLNQKRGMTSFC
jgi:hypothetical protein